MMLGILKKIFCGCFRERKALFEVVGEELAQFRTQIDDLTKLNRLRHEQRQKGEWRILVGGFSVFGVVAAWLYLLGSNDPTFRTTRIAVLVFFPILILGLRQQFAWFMNYGIRRRTARIKQLETRLERRLEDLKQQTNYERTQSLINKFQTPVKKPQPQGSPAAPPRTGRRTGRRGVPGSATKPPRIPPTPGARPGQPGAPLATPGMGQVKLAMDTADVVTPLQRTNMDKLFDYLLGEGPNNRYALICTNCATHNGLIREEDLGMRYRCSACGFLNGKAPKQIPTFNSSSASARSSAVSTRGSPPMDGGTPKTVEEETSESEAKEAEEEGFVTPARKTRQQQKHSSVGVSAKEEPEDSGEEAEEEEETEGEDREREADEAVGAED